VGWGGSKRFYRWAGQRRRRKSLDEMHVIAISGNLMGLATWFFIISASRGFSELIPGARAVRCRGRRGDKVAVVLGGEEGEQSS
jgi:predicted membrane metal-binding protein